MKIIPAIALMIVASATTQTTSAEPSSSCAPGVTFASLLGSVDVGSTDPRLRIDTLYAICLPEPKTQSHSSFTYDPDEGGRLSSTVRDASGKALATYVWRGERVGNLWELSDYKVLGGYESTKPLAAGNYTLEFAAEGRPFYRFPFSIAVADSDDLYQAPGKRYFIDGPWGEYANLFYQRNDPESSLQFTIWMQDRAARPLHQTETYEAQLMRARDRSLIAADHGQMHAERRWQPLGLLLKPVGDKGKPYLKARDILQEDGIYCVRLTRNGKLEATYAFTVSGGKIQVQGRQLESTDPQTRIVDYQSGGRYRSWWIPRQ